MAKNSSILTKALNEADTIRAGALKNAQDILLAAFQPHFKQMFDNVVNEQVGVVNQDPMDGPNPSKYDQDKSEADLVNPNNAMHAEGDGPELLEQEEDEVVEEQTEDDEVVEEQVEGDDDFLEQLEMDPDLDEQTDGADDVDIEVTEQSDEEDLTIEQGDLDDLNVEQTDDTDDLDLEQADDFDLDNLDLEQTDDIEIVDEQTEDDEVVEEQVEDEKVEEQACEKVEEQDNPDVNTSKDASTVTAANEAKKYKLMNRQLVAKNNQLVKENAQLVSGVQKLSARISEIQLFNAKVACANRILSTKSVNEGTKVSVLNTLDKCKTIREVKLAYSSFKNLVQNQTKRVASIKESRNLASLKNKTMGYRKPLVTESDNKMLRLAGLKD